MGLCSRQTSIRQLLPTHSAPFERPVINVRQLHCRQQAIADNERLRQLQEAEAASEAEAVAAARAVEYRNELRHRLDIQVMLKEVSCSVVLPFASCEHGRRQFGGAI